MNEQPWDFVLSTQRETLRQLAETWRYAGHVARSAATVALVAPIPVDQDSRDWIFYDMGQATMSMVLSRGRFGIGSSHAALEDQPLARQIWDFPRIASAWALSPSDTRPIARFHHRPSGQAADGRRHPPRALVRVTASADGLARK